MSLIEDKKNKKKKLDKLFPVLLGSAFLIIITFTIMSVIADKKPNKKRDKSTFQASEVMEPTETTPTIAGDKQILAVLKKIDTKAGTMTLYDIESGEDLTLNYTGGTNILDKYEQVIATSQLKIGEMVDAYYKSEEIKLVKLQISKLAWEYPKVNNWSIDGVNRIFKIVNTKYQFKSSLVILGEDQFIEVSDLDEKDQLTVKGYGKEIYSIIVTKGHGTIKLEDYEDFIGGTIYVGEDIVPVTTEMSITVREGSFDLTLENGSLKGTKKITVGRDEDVLVNFGEFKKPATMTGLVKFEILPEGADLYIDDLLQSYDNAVELEYGEHSMRVDLGGYTPYSGTLVVEEASKTLFIDLVEGQASITTDVTNNENQNNNEENNNPDITGENDYKPGATSDAEGNQGNTGEGGQGNEVEPGEIDYERNIYIQKPEGASIYFNGAFKGAAPVSFPKETGTHYITLIQDGYETKTYTVEVVDDGEDVNFNFPEMSKTN